MILVYMEREEARLLNGGENIVGDIMRRTGNKSGIWKRGMIPGCSVVVSWTLLSFVVPCVGEQTFSKWSARQGLSPQERAPTASPAGDGISNALKYLLGVSPLDPVPPSRKPRGVFEEIDGGVFFGMEVLRDPAASDASCTLDAFRDLMSREKPAGPVILIEDSPDRWRAGVRMESEERLFLRLGIHLDADPVPWHAWDSFDRADTGTVSGEEIPSVIGSDWRSGSPSGHWRIQDGRLDLHSVDPQGRGLLYNVAQPTANRWEGESFTLSGTVILESGAPTGWAGLLVNYQETGPESGSGAVFRYNGEGRIQMLRPNGTAFLDLAGAFSHVPGRPYRLTVFPPEPYVYDLRVVDTVTDTVVFSVLEVVNDCASRNTGGYGGFFATTGLARFDEFALGIHQWNEPFSVEPQEGWSLAGGQFVSSLGGLEPLQGDSFWTAGSGDGQEGTWILTDRLFEPGELTVSYYAGDRAGFDWNVPGGGMLWADTREDGSWSRPQRLTPDRTHRSVPEGGWRLWTDTYRITRDTRTAEGYSVIGNRIGFFLNTPLGENEQFSLDRLRIDFTPGPAKEKTILRDPVEASDGWSVHDNQFSTGTGGLMPEAGDTFWTVSGVTGNRQPAKLFDAEFEPGILTVSYRVGGLEGRTFPDRHNVFLWADDDPSGIWAWHKRLLPLTESRPVPEEGWVRWTDTYLVTGETRTAGGDPVSERRIGFVFRALDLVAGDGIAFDDLVIRHTPFDRRIDPRHDPRFSEGLVLLDPDNSAGKVPVDLLDFGRGDTLPEWEVAQWWSDYSLEGVEPQPLVPGGMGYENEAKSILLTPSGNEHAGLILGVNSGVEYNYVPRKQGEPWPHLFVSQRLRQHAALSLADLTSVPFSAKTRLLHYEKFNPSQQSDSLHAAQYLIYFTVQNLNRDSEDYGNYFWFGLRPYDNRYAFPPQYISPDTGSEYKPGTGKLIYNPAMEPLMDRSMHTGEWASIQGDLFPYIQNGFAYARDRGYIHPDSRPEDFFIASLTIGWEVPGLFDVAVQLKDLDLWLIRD